MQTKKLTQTALMTAVICILSPLTLPIGPVPVSLANLAVCLCVYLLGTKYGAISYFIYYLLGCMGLPVFSGFGGGLGKALGPTGGFLLGFFVLILIGGIFIKHFKNIYMHFFGLLLGDAAVYLIGVPWFAAVAHTDMYSAFLTACAPFILIDIIKIFFVTILGSEITKRIKPVS
ncbi:MAG: biotin transporter BioY [Firmicutes bacterium]|nr:biotin transporter BioY [Bacillota bacterium]